VAPHQFRSLRPRRLDLPHARVDAVGIVGQQRGVRARLGDGSRGEHDDDVGVGDRAKPVRHHELRGFSRRSLPQPRLEAPLGHAVELAGGLVERKTPGALEDGPGDADALPLSARRPLDSRSAPTAAPAAPRSSPPSPAARPLGAYTAAGPTPAMRRWISLSLLSPTDRVAARDAPWRVRLPLLGAPGTGSAGGRGGLRVARPSCGASPPPVCAGLLRRFGGGEAVAGKLCSDPGLANPTSITELRSGKGQGFAFRVWGFKNPGRWPAATRSPGGPREWRLSRSASPSCCAWRGPGGPPCEQKRWTPLQQGYLGAMHSQVHSPPRRGASAGIV